MPRVTVDLVTAAEYVNLPVERLKELTDANLAPYVRLDGGEPRYHKKTLSDWVDDNLLTVSQGIRLRPLEVIKAAIRNFTKAKVPVELSAVDPLCEFHLDLTARVPGIYFLCDKDQVVYVGQSTCIAARIAQHVGEGKKVFDRVFYVPVPPSELINVEAEFIKQLRPKYNGNGVFNTSNQWKEDAINAILDEEEEEDEP